MAKENESKEFEARVKEMLKVTKVDNMYQFADLLVKMSKDVKSEGEPFLLNVDLKTSTVSQIHKNIIHILMDLFPESMVVADVAGKKAVMTITGPQLLVETVNFIRGLIEETIMAFVKVNTDGTRASSVSLKRQYYKDLANEVSDMVSPVVIEGSSSEGTKKEETKEETKEEAKKEEKSVKKNQVKAKAKTIKLAKLEPSDEVDDFEDDFSDKDLQEVYTQIPEDEIYDDEAPFEVSDEGDLFED